MHNNKLIKQNSMTSEPETAPIVELARQEVQHMLRQRLTEDHRYHSLRHTERVCEALQRLGKASGLEAEQLEILELAGLFHDTGFVETYEGHEAISRQIAGRFLQQQGYPAEKTETVLRLIEVTFPPKEPSDLLEQLMCDADLSNLGSERYLEYLEQLRHEWAVFLNQTYTDDQWYTLNHKFVKSHQYYTNAAQEQFGEQWKNNRKKLKDLRNAARVAEGPEKPAKQAVATPPPVGQISSNKSAQTMFKTSLRNHLDLAALADNKANIMLSVNALIITIVMPLAANYVQSNLYALIPMASLLLTCLTSMVYATLATRPIKMSGATTPQTITRGESNLFFFGNFFKMPYAEYEKGMREVIGDDQKLDRSIMRDLYYLGTSLGRKYRQLRVCYTIFMWGVIVSVALFALLYSWSINH